MLHFSLGEFYCGDIRLNNLPNFKVAIKEDGGKDETSTFKAVRWKQTLSNDYWKINEVFNLKHVISKHVLFLFLSLSFRIFFLYPSSLKMFT